MRKKIKANNLAKGSNLRIATTCLTQKFFRYLKTKTGKFATEMSVCYSKLTR